MTPAEQRNPIDGVKDEPSPLPEQALREFVATARREVRPLRRLARAGAATATLQARSLAVAEILMQSGLDLALRHCFPKKIGDAVQWLCEEVPRICRAGLQGSGLHARGSDLFWLATDIRNLCLTLAGQPLGSAEAGSATLAAERAGAIPPPASGSNPAQVLLAYRTRGPCSWEKVASRLGVSRDTLYSVKGESKWHTDPMYALMAKGIGCRPDELHPRDLPRPKKRQ